MKALPDKFQQLFEAFEPGQYTLLKAQPYEAHRFCTPTIKKGRMVLVGDSAHLFNPYSGQLLACGIFDASSLAQCLVSVVQQSTPSPYLKNGAETTYPKSRMCLTHCHKSGSLLSEILML